MRAAAGLQHGRRYLLGIAGIPGSGKSTLAAKVVAALNQGAGPEEASAVLVPMDGFHLPNRELVARGLREMKGAPETFDAPAYLALLAQVRGIRPGEKIRFPVYDRTRHEPVWPDEAGAGIGEQHHIVVTEGNYLLLQEEPWVRVRGMLDACWWLETPVEQARGWILARHERGGREAASARGHYERCDLANTRRILERSAPADLRVRWA